MNNSIVWILLAIVVGAGLWWFFANPRTASAPDTSLGTPVEFSVLEEGAQSNVIERKNYLARTPEALEELWKMVHGEEAEVPVVDFSTSEVIGVFQGQKSTGGYAIKVEKVLDSETARTLYLTLYEPASGCPVAQALTTPFEIITLP